MYVNVGDTDRGPKNPTKCSRDGPEDKASDGCDHIDIAHDAIIYCMYVHYSLYTHCAVVHCAVIYVYSVNVINAHITLRCCRVYSDASNIYMRKNSVEKFGTIDGDAVSRDVITILCDSRRFTSYYAANITIYE